MTALETNDATAAFAALQAAQELETKAEAQLGSGEDAETLKKKMLADRAKARQDYLKKQKEKKEKELKKKKAEEEKVKLIQKKFEELKK